MYLCHSIEPSRVKGMLKLELFTWRVELNAVGRPIWKLHTKGYWYRGYSEEYMTKQLRNRGHRDVPFMQDAATNRPVTMKQAEVLTGMLPPAALDYLTERVNDGPALSNYVKPPKEKPPAPEPEPKPVVTPADRCRAKLAKAEAKVREWESARQHADKKAKEWSQKARQQRRRLERLEGVPTAAEEA